MRLQKFLAQAGVGSRRYCETLITTSSVTVNGVLVCELGTSVDPKRDVVRLNGKIVSLEKIRVFLFYKPLKTLTSMADGYGRRTVADYFAEIKERVYPVGRLDYNTEGLLIMTNKGSLAYKLTHPSHKVLKQYVVAINGAISSCQLNQLRMGLELDDGITAPAIVKLLVKQRYSSTIKIGIIEGRKRQIRRMFAKIGYEVIHLKRFQIGNLSLGSLQTGQYRELCQHEVWKLLQKV
ncbi:MAG: ribosomal large subunit pseudouridine synthase [Bacillota bacterium]|jgi:23S rRNA pseudouridine2605 synthase